MSSFFSKLPPSVIALLMQFTAFGLTLAGIHLIGIQPKALSFTLACGVLAALLSYFVKLARWWLIIQLLFLPCVVLTLSLNISPIFFLAIFLVMLLMYWSTFHTQVPLYLSSNKVWQALEGLLPVAKKNTPFSFIDLGCGLGGVLTHLAKIRPDGRYHGVELAPLPFAWSWLRVRLGAYSNCHVQRGSLWDCDLAHYDVVFAYLSPVPMEKLWRKARGEMRPGSLFISSTFVVPDQNPRQIIQIDDLHHSTLLVWRM